MQNKTLQAAQQRLVALDAQYNKKASAKNKILKQLESLQRELHELELQVQATKQFIEKITNTNNG